MRLYLSSFQVGNEPGAFLSLIGKNKRVALIANAADTAADEAERTARVNKQIGNMSSLGLIPEEVDLRQFFGNSPALQTRMEPFGSVWVSGGNCFVLKRAFEQSGFDRLVSGKLEQNTLVYGAYSAGVMVTMPTMRGIDICDDPNVVPQGYRPEVDWNGLALIDYTVVPHYRSDHPESAVMEKVVRYLEQNGLPYKPLRDGEAIVINGPKQKIVGISPIITYVETGLSPEF